MIGYVLRRLMQLLPVVLVASLGIWGMIYAVPGSPVGAIVGEDATPEQIAAGTARLGLDKPVIEQYWLYLRVSTTAGFVNRVTTRTDCSRDRRSLGTSKMS